ncbi:RDD family protein [Conexibacter stalactiti]|uniref:RDD family protein n=1 Tax=Conexibacter stalactiti TaxID=1940611 RepID=A0ABU4HNQ3_9ACTN|nr:RDD family protein [Conexibacter stalactiti]MDW5593674.1 RDD family protein [Conexibacter stalactiti]MEC5034315.1 RDD family protein [Conexibacter stalactiti]
MIDARPGELTGEQGQVTYELAAYSTRVWAFLIDLLPFVALGLLIAIGVSVGEGSTDSDDARELTRTLALALGIPLTLLYAPLLLIRRGARNGQTLGKQAMRIRVVRESGEPVTLGNALMREVVGRQLLIAFTYGVYAVIDYAWPLWDRSRQALHDKVAQTRVVLAEPVRNSAAGTFTTGLDAHAPQPPLEPVEPAEPAQPATGSTAPPPAPADDAPVRDGWLPPRASS